MVDVYEAYKDFAPACNAREVVLDLLASVPPAHLAGLRSVVLTNVAALGYGRRRARTWSRGRKVRQSEALGLYHGQSRGEPAWIEIFVDRLQHSAPGWVMRFPMARSAAFGGVLYHEIGHHIHATQRPEHREREDVADEWERHLARIHTRRRYPLARLVLKPVARAANALCRRRYRLRPREGGEHCG